LDRICNFISVLGETSAVVNVAGSRESKSPGIERTVSVVMTEVISRVNGRCFYPSLPEGNEKTEM
jgi:hypothetical protein